MCGKIANSCVSYSQKRANERQLYSVLHVDLVIIHVITYSRLEESDPESKNNIKAVNDQTEYETYDVWIVVGKDDALHD